MVENDDDDDQPFTTIVRFSFKRLSLHYIPFSKCRYGFRVERASFSRRKVRYSRLIGFIHSFICSFVHFVFGQLNDFATVRCFTGWNGSNKLVVLCDFTRNFQVLYVLIGLKSILQTV